MLKQNCCLADSHFPPSAIAEVLQDYVANFHKVRRLHLTVVDLWQPWKYNTVRAREITDQLWFIRDCANTRRVSPFRPDGPEPPLRCRRFAIAMRWTALSSHAVWCGHKEMSGRTSFWTLLRLTRLSWIKHLSFAHWACSTSITPMHWSLKCACAECSGALRLK